MGVGDQIKANVDAIRATLGSACTLNAVAIGECSIHDLSAASAKELLSPDYQDEIGTRWAMIETPSEAVPEEQDVLTLTATGKDYIVTRVSPTLVAGVICAYRCLCLARTV